MTRYLLSTGRSTTRIERYILDLFKLNLLIWPGDIPNLNVGFDFILTDTKKDEILTEVRSRVDTLVTRLKNKFSSQNIDIDIDSIELIDEEKVRITVSVDDYSDYVTVSLYNE